MQLEKHTLIIWDLGWGASGFSFYFAAQTVVHIPAFIFVCVCVRVMCVYLCIPEQTMHRVMPRLMEAQSGPASPQSQHCWFPAMTWTSSRAWQPWLSWSTPPPPPPPPPTPPPPPAPALLTDMELQRCLWVTHRNRNKRDSYRHFPLYPCRPAWVCMCSLPGWVCPLFSPGRLRRCCSARRWSRLAAAALNPPAADNTCAHMQTTF